MKVFISSTYVDLVEYRKKAIDVVNRFECTPLAMELFVSQPQEPIEVCADKIKECNIFIGIYAHRYGFIPKGETKSITQLEYELAKTEGKDCLCFIVDEKFPWVPAFIETKKQKQLKAFLDIVRQQRVLSFFTNPLDFETKLTASLGKYLAEKKEGPESKQRIMGKESYIPCAPYPYMAHPYALPEHFTGRRAEMAMLSNWFFNEEEPVFVLEAIGGMGKSALSWAWLHQEIMEKAVKIDGIFWWSFYDEPFELFINRLYCYVTGKDSSQSIAMDELKAALNQRRFLLVLDGFERALRGYAGMEAMYIQEKRFAGDTKAESEWDKRQREPVHPLAGRFLQALCAGNSKTLMTTRLMPVSLEEIRGVKHVFLTGLSTEDTVNFFRSEGINGTHAEMEQAGKVYEFHPLMLKLLVSAIKRSRARDINEAFSLNIIDQKEPHKILERSVQLLSEEEWKVATCVAVFRGAFTFDAVKALAQEIEEKRLWEVMQELRGLGFLFYDETRDYFDFHPILRSYLYGQLTSFGGTEVHDLAAQYFKALPKPEKVVTLGDLAPVIELYHHLVKTGKFDEAYELFDDRIGQLTYFQLSAFHLIIELLKELFPGGEIDGQLPLPTEESGQAWTMNTLGNAYAFSGQPANAVPLLLLKNKLNEKNDAKRNLAKGLVNVAALAQIYIGQLSASAGHLRKSIALFLEIKDEFWEAYGHMEFGRVMAYQENVFAEEEFEMGFDFAEEKNHIHAQGLTSAYRSLSVLLRARLAAVIPVQVSHSPQLSQEALHQARQALTFTEKWSETNYPLSRDFFEAYWLLGEALIQCSAFFKEVKIERFDIPFYDDYFQHVVETVTVTDSTKSVLSAAAKCLHEALRRCRKTNMVDIELDILLAHVRLDVAQNKPPDESLLKEALEIALRSGYRLKLADLHLFCGQVLLQFKDMKTLLGLTAHEHLQKTKEYALDVSQFSDLYSPVKSTMDEFYKDIPEYDMLKRGMTDEERKKNGYWIAYQIAERLEKCPQNTRTGENTEL